MKYLSTAEIRSTFIDFFKSKGHTHLPSSPLVPYNDPTVLLTTAGMLQFKPIMFGTEKPTHSRATTYQKCFRTTDLENVGFTPRHHTFFEMLGNFSFGDYYKEDAIAWAYDLVFNQLGLPKERVYVTVFETDDEAYDLWHNKMGIPAERMVRRDGETNFWAAGDTGPCGPCSELYFDKGAEYDDPITPVRPGDDNDNRYLEFYNLVFMEFNRQADGSLIPLPAKNIDTGMGLERIASIIQGKQNNYEIDLFQSIMAKIEELADPATKDHPQYRTALQVIADHARASVLLISDGVVPGNEGRGYVLRRVMRRAIRFGHVLGINKAFLYTLQPAIEALFGHYPEVLAKRDFISETIQTEEERFQKTLSRGMKQLEEALEAVRAAKQTVVPGAVAFELYDTYGFPLELTQEIAEEQKLSVDVAGYKTEMQKQVERARSAARSNLDLGAGVVGFPPTEFLGYQSLTSEAKVLAVLDTASADLRRLVLDRTPFYAESGGQVSDHGLIEAGAHRFEVVDVQKVGEVVVHVVQGSDWSPLSAGQTVTGRVASEVRSETMKHHSVTHLLHQALKDVLGEHVHQAGSEVAHDHTRFDFTYNRPVTADEVRRIETIVNEQIMANLPVETVVLPIDEAKATGAVSMFGEKYGDVVRVIGMGHFSKEFCGGTHVPATGVIGSFKVISEEAIAAGTRRIIGVAGKTALQYGTRNEELLKGLAQELKVPFEEIPGRFAKLQDTLRSQEKELKQLKQKLALQQVDSLIDQFQEQAGYHWIATQIEVADAAGLKQVAEALANRKKPAVVVLGAEIDGKANLVALVDAGLSKQVKAGDLIKELAPLVGAKGGGKPEFAQAGGGTDPSQFTQVAQKLPSLLPNGVAV